MGANISCPADFERGVGLSCHMRCPRNFKYAQEGGGSEPLVEKCVFVTNNDYFVTLRPLPSLGEDQQETDMYVNERNRFSQELRALNERIQREGPVQDRIVSFQDQRSTTINEYNRIQSEYANYSSASAVANNIKQVTDSLKPMRPPVAGSEVATERTKLLQRSEPNMLVIQIALAVVVLSLLTYIIVPAEYAHMLAFLLLSVGVAVGIFLKK